MAQYGASEVLAAIKKLGEVSLCGFSGVTEDDLPTAMQLMEPYENAEIERAILGARARKAKGGGI